jgi:hypothetical protein
MDGLMPQSSRSLLASRILDQCQDEEGTEKFLERCNLKSGLPHVSVDMDVNETDLAAFCNRWMNVEGVRDGDEIKILTKDMCKIRHTIIQELVSLSEGPGTC